jgi:hypothetical protein
VLRRPWIGLTLTTAVASPILLVVGVLVARTNSPWLEPSWLDVSAKSTGSFVVLGPALAALSAWDAARWRVLSVLPVRGSVQLLVRHLAVVAAVTLVTFAGSAVVLVATVRPPTGLPDVGVLTTGVWMVVAYSAVGFALGQRLPRTVAAPLAFALVWCWVAYTPAIEPFWLRNVTGNLAASCCTLDTELVDHALQAPAVIGAALVLGSLLVVRWPGAVVAGVTSLALVAAAVGLASSWMAGVGADPVTAREDERVCVQRDGTSLCAWPEHAALGRLKAGADGLGAAAGRLRAAGLPVPARLDEGASAHDGWSFDLSGPSVRDWVRTLATSPLSALPPDCIEDGGGAWPAGDRQPLVAAWLEVVAGAASPRQAADDAGAAPVELARLLRRDAGDQAAWYRTTRAALDGCDPLP